MTKNMTAQTPKIPETAVPSDWQQAYLESASMVGATWLGFMGERFHAYAHVVDDIGHCHDLNEAWRVQSAFSQETAKAYTEQAAKLGGKMLEATNGGTGEAAK